MDRKELSKIIIDDMTVSDVQEILAIETASSKTPWSEPLFYNEIFKNMSISRVAKIDGKVVGYICANLIIDEGHILNLAVHPEYRRLGIASDMMREMIDVMRDRQCRSIFLEARVSNEEACKMYENFGFRLLGTRKNYYVSPVEDAVIMVLRFTG